MNRCKKCILPENYTNISFNEEGICSHCTTDIKAIEYLGKDLLLDDINSFLKTKKGRNKNYDCIIPFSGGRDSSYILYYFSKVLKLRVVAFSVDNGFLPEQTITNIHKSAEICGAKLVLIKNDNLKKTFRYHMKAWMKKPTPALIGLMCTGCYYPIVKNLFKYAKLTKIPIIVWGESPFEHGSYKYDLLRTNSKNTNHYSFISGYLRQIMHNPRLFINPTCTIRQLKEYVNKFYIKRKTTNNKEGILFFSPFLKYIRWTEVEINRVLDEELKWKKNPDVEDKWRGDCNIALLKLWLYKELIGFNDKEPGLSSLVRDGQISREEALKRLEEECKVPDKIVKKVFEEYELDFNDMLRALKKYQES